MTEKRLFIEENAKEEIWGRRIEHPTVDVEKCKGCGKCIRVCPLHVLQLQENKCRVLYGSACISCGHCWAVCPEEALYQQEIVAETDLNIGPGPAVPPNTLQLLLRERRSIRLFTREPVLQDQLERIIDVGRYGPTGSNRQEINYIVLSTSEKVNELRTLVEGFMEKTFKALDKRLISWLCTIRYGRTAINLLRSYSMAYQFIRQQKKQNAYFPLPNGSAVLIVTAKSFDSVAPFNCAVAIYNCSLIANSMGLGTCFLGFVQLGANLDIKIRRWLNMPKQYQCYGAMVIGHPDVHYRRLIGRKKPNVIWR